MAGREDVWGGWTVGEGLMAVGGLMEMGEEL